VVRPFDLEIPIRFGVVVPEMREFPENRGVAKRGSHPIQMGQNRPGRICYIFVEGKFAKMQVFISLHMVMAIVRKWRVWV
jgi:hypothetical protein